MLDFQYDGISLIGAQKRPRIVWRGSHRAAAASLAVVSPKVPGLLSVLIPLHFGGTAQLGLPSGYTQLDANNASATIPGALPCYRFLDGSESESITLSATGATEIVAFSYLLAGVSASMPPRANNSSISATNTRTFQAFTADLGATSDRLVLYGMMLVGAIDCISTPYVPAFDPTARQNVLGTNYTFCFEARTQLPHSVLGEGSFVLSTTANGRCSAVIVRGA